MFKFRTLIITIAAILGVVFLLSISGISLIETHKTFSLIDLF